MDSLDRIMPIPRYYFPDWYPKEFDHLVISTLKAWAKKSRKQKSR
jgi:hypothetical protein